MDTSHQLSYEPATPAAEKPKPWLIAAWPGMGNVAIIAATYLIQQLGMVEGAELQPGNHFDVLEVEVKNGIVAPPHLPVGAFLRWKNPGPGRDLVVFVSPAQPAAGNYSYANELLDAARRFGVERVVTFASLASGLHPAENPKVSGVATDAKTLSQLRLAEVEPLSDGQIGGLNGLLLGVAAARGIEGMCLLAEIPFFAMRVPNPKAARAALSVFSVLAGIDVSLEALDKHAAVVDRALIEAMEQMKQENEDEGDQPAEATEHIEPAPEVETVDPSHDSGSPGALSPNDSARIEELFALARRDPTEATRLKRELDRLGVFKQFEGRFLDLFRRAG
ncbi:MAG: PAC2 family protein [Planctomycetes bacterium]|nr:PAC2 family protein [Planctomycetota bacterium]